MTDFLPKAYEVPSQGGNYMKFKQGDNNFRILSSAIIGYEYWTNENKPVRSKEQFEETPNAKEDKNGKVSVKHFWAFVAVDLSDNEIKILEVTQVSIQNTIMSFVQNDKWGDPKGYDINVNRTGEGIETDYTVMPSPHLKLDKEVEKTYKEMEINLEALYDGANPFEKKAGKPEEVEEVPKF